MINENNYVSLLRKMLHMKIKIGAGSIQKSHLVKKHKSLLNKAKMQRATHAAKSEVSK